MVLLLAVGVLIFTTGVALLVLQNVMRERAMEAEALLGARAALAADGALAWFLAGGWTSPAGREDGAGVPDTLLAVPARVLEDGPRFRQDGEIRVLYLGGGEVPGRDVWKLTLEARHHVTAGSRTLATYRQLREVYVTTPAGVAGAAPALGGWRTVH